jgi:hypothetical protein
VPDDERTRRRLGDATRSRIDDLASGWSLDQPSGPAPDKPAPEPEPEHTDTADTIDTSDTIDDVSPPKRKRSRTLPPPPPGSDARKALEEAIVNVVTPPPVATAPKERVLSVAKKPPTMPPPIPARAKTATSPPKAPAPIDRMPPVIIDAALIEEHRSIAAEIAAAKPGALRAKPNLTGPVPIGEFDSGSHDPEEEAKLRTAHAQAQATEIHHTADALLGIPAQPRTVVKETPIGVLLDETAARLQIDSSKPTVDPSTVRFERADPTSEGRDDATEIQSPSDHKATSGTLRASAMLRRKRGAMGDVRYVFTALFGLRAAKK